MVINILRKQFIEQMVNVMVQTCDATSAGLFNKYTGNHRENGDGYS